MCVSFCKNAQMVYFQQLFREKINLKLKSTTVRCQRLSANTRMYNTKSVGMSKNNVFVYDKNDKDFLNYAVIYIEKSFR